MSRIPESAVQKIKNQPDKKIKVSKDNLDDSLIRFSFSFWSQTELFGLDKSTPEWFIDLLDKLKGLSTNTVEDFSSNVQLRSSLRIHNINWNQSGTTQEKFNTLIPAQYRGDDYEICQFKITDAKGRVIGFFDETNTFQVVLLDIAHNMQLTNYNNYNITITGELPNSYVKVLGKITKIHEKIDKCKDHGQLMELKDELLAIAKEEYSHGHYIFISDMHHEKINELLTFKDHDELDCLLIEALDAFYKLKKPD